MSNNGTAHKAPVACKLCNDFGYVYLVDEDPNDPNGTIKTQRDCWECGERGTDAGS